ncbi:MAG: hypothetical protein QGI45_01655, partial [Myxococcota bacterium]|nr:hypothetical protein [Myxococcota bacterium]
ELPPHSELEFYGFCDPSLGRTAKSDFSCISTLGRHQKSGEIYVVDVDMARCPAGQIRTSILSKFQQFSYRQFAGENNSFQAVLTCPHICVHIQS